MIFFDIFCFIFFVFYCFFFFGDFLLKLGLFGANCSSGRNVTKVPERWSGNWPDNLGLARMAVDAGIDFMLPFGRW